MAADLILDPDAEADVARAYGRYEGQRAGLGEDFLSCVEACLDAVRRTPLMHQAVFKTYRRSLVRRFPYAAYYEYDAGTDTVTVYVIIHTAQNPDTWRGRLP